jgi:hypothetical protein
MFGSGKSGMRNNEGFLGVIRKSRVHFMKSVPNDRPKYAAPWHVEPGSLPLANPGQIFWKALRFNDVGSDGGKGGVFDQCFLSMILG